MGDARRVLHVLNTSLPLVNGYALRSHGMLKALHAAGTEVHAVSSPFHPNKQELIDPATIDGITYHRCPHPLDDSSIGLIDRLARPTGRLRLGRTWTPSAATGQSSPSASRGGRRKLSSPLRRVRHHVVQLEQAVLVRRFARRIRELCLEHDIELIHAHSPARNFRAAHRVARQLGIPIIYEVRGLQELTAVAEGRLAANDPLVRLWSDAQTHAMLRADHVVVLSETLRAEAIRRGVSPQCVSVVSNACDPDPTIDSSSEIVRGTASWFERSPGLRIGFVGAVQRFEGIHTLLDATSKLVDRGVDVKVLIAGPNLIGSALDARLVEPPFNDRVRHVGRVAPGEAVALLDLLEVCVVPRIDAEVTRLVTPLKPLDAMSRACCVVLSDLPASRELVEDGKTGLLVPAEDPESLADCLEGLALQPADHRRMARASRSWVNEHRTWAQAVSAVQEIQSAVLGCGATGHE